MKYKILEGIATADVAYEVYGKTIEELFENAAEAIEQTMVDLKNVKPVINQQLSVTNQQLEILLLDFLNELLFYKDSQRVIFSRFRIRVSQLDAIRYTLDANLWGEKIDIEKHKLRGDVKAVTRHKFLLKKKANGYIARIVLDI